MTRHELREMADVGMDVVGLSFCGVLLLGMTVVVVGGGIAFIRWVLS